jgi:transcriptional regulator with GAF, ATPase, and Fis domain
MLDEEVGRCETELCRHYMSRALSQVNGDRRKAAALLGLDYTLFSYYAKKAGLRDNASPGEEV